jgi:hypothetical protein
MRPSPSTYMQAAKEAVNYVKKSMPYGSVNNPGDWVSKSFVGPFISAYQQYKGFKDGIMPELQELSKTAKNLPKEERNLIMMEVWAKHAVKMKAGNCSLQAALAFQYLRTDKKMFPVEVMQLRHKNHGFVILGRPADTDLENFSDWTKDAILCDPWRHNVGIAAQLVTWFNETKVDLICRVEG